jgi:hypothetical protein
MSDQRIRRPEDMMDPDTGLLPRERELVNVLAAFHQEFGVTTTVTSQALAHLTGESWPGSLAGLSMKGYVAAERKEEEKAIGYRLSERGWALFVGLPEEMVGPVDGAIL